MSDLVDAFKYSIITLDIYQKAIEGFNVHLKEYIIKNLKEFGFNFENEEQLKEFIRTRLTRTAHINQPHEYELYLDFQTKNQKLIAIYNDKVKIIEEGSKVSAIIGD